MKKTITIIFLLLLFITFVSAESPIRELEVTTYPTVDGVQPTDTSIGIEAYIKYLFSLVFVLLGVIFFAILLYNGVKYMISAGSPEKAGSAISGIKGAFLGVIILLSSWMVLNTINPNFWTLEIVEPEEVLPTLLAPGVYVCNYEMSGIGGIISGYSNPGTRAAAINEYYEKRSEENERQNCIFVNTWANILLTSSVLGYGNTYFVIPHINSDGSVEERHGAIFFRREEGLKEAIKTGGEKCEIHIGNTGNYHLDFETFDVVSSMRSSRSVYPIRVNLNTEDNQSVVFYEGYSFNEDVPGNNAFYENFDEETDDDLSFREVQVGSTTMTLDHSSFGSDFNCREAGILPVRDTCGIRSVKMTEDVFIVFKNGDFCHLVESSKSYLDESIPSEKYSWLGSLERGFKTGIYFDTIEIIRGKIMR